MKYIIICPALIFIICSSAFAQKQDVPVVKFDHLKRIMNKKNDSVYVINFWATWCKPCIQEIPEFEQLTRAYKDQKVQIILVSLDFKKNYESKLLPFLRKRDISSKVILLDETDYNSWINKVEPSWSGAIPATLIIKNSDDFRKFLEKEIKFNEIKSIIEPLI